MYRRGLCMFLAVVALLSQGACVGCCHGCCHAAGGRFIPHIHVTGWLCTLVARDPVHDQDCDDGHDDEAIPPARADTQRGDVVCLPTALAFGWLNQRSSWDAGHDALAATLPPPPSWRATIAGQPPIKVLPAPLCPSAADSPVYLRTLAILI